MILEELLVKVGVKTDTKELTKLELSLKNLPAIAGAVGAVAAASIAGLSAFVSMSLNALDSIHQLSNETGVAADKIYLLGKVAELNGSSVEAAEASYKGLSKAIGEAANGIGLGAKAFENFGIQAKNADGSVRDASEVLDDIREKMQDMSDQQQIAMLAKLGIDASLIQTLRLTNEEMEEALANAEALSLGVGTQENAATAAAFQDSLAEVGQIAKGVAEYFSLRLAPALMRIIGLFRDWFIANNQLIKNGLNFFAGILGAAIDVIGALANILDTIIGGTIGWGNALYGLVAVLAIVKKAMIMAFVTNPIAWVVAAIVGLILLIDDFIAYMQGGETALGDFWEPLAKGVDKVIEVIDELRPIIAQIVEWFEPVVDLMAEQLKTAFSIIGNLFNLLVGIFTLNGDVISESLQGLVANIVSLFTNGFEGLTYIFDGLWTFIQGFFALLLDGIKFWWGKLRSVFDAEGLAEPFDRFTNYVTGLFDRLLAWISKQWDKLKEVFSADSLGEGLSKLGQLLISTVVDVLSFLGEIVVSIFDLIFEQIESWWGDFLALFNVESIGELFDKVWDFITSPFRRAFARVKSLWSLFKGDIDVNAVKTAFSKVVGSITTPFTNAFNSVKKKWETFKAELDVESIGELFGKVLDFITAPFKNAWDSVKKAWEEFSSSGFSFDGLKKAFSKVTSVITAPFESAFGWVKEQYAKYIQPIIDSISGIKMPSWFSGSNKAVEQHVQNGGQAVRRPDGSVAIPIADSAKAGAVNNTTHNNTQVKNDTSVNVHLTTTNTVKGDALMMGNAVANAVRNTQSPILA